MTTGIWIEGIQSLKWGTSICFSQDSGLGFSWWHGNKYNQKSILKCQDGEKIFLVNNKSALHEYARSYGEVVWASLRTYSPSSGLCLSLYLCITVLATVLYREVAAERTPAVACPFSWIIPATCTCLTRGWSPHLASTCSPKCTWLLVSRSWWFDFCSRRSRWWKADFSWRDLLNERGNTPVSSFKNRHLFNQL